jgi:hypothetical protein
MYGVAPAVLRAILDFLGTDVFPLPDAAQQMAIRHAKANGRATPQNNGGVNDHESNYLAMAWYLQKLRAAYGGDWTPVARYFGDGPVGEQKAARVARQFYPVYERRWR